MLPARKLIAGQNALRDQREASESSLTEALPRDVLKWVDAALDQGRVGSLRADPQAWALFLEQGQDLIELVEIFQMGAQRPTKRNL